MTSKDLFKGTTYNSLEEQVGGKHYRSMKIQPAEFINENKLLFAEGNAIKYICRCLLYTSPSPRDLSTSRMPSSA